MNIKKGDRVQFIKYEFKGREGIVCEIIDKTAMVLLPDQPKIQGVNGGIIITTGTHNLKLINENNQ